MNSAVDNEPMQTVWDPLLRIFHWSLLLFFFLAYALQDDWLGLHGYAGYTVGLLIVFRLVWGFIGSRHARFTDFIAPPSAVSAYLAQMLRGNARRYLGHNPAGALMIAVLMASLLCSVVSGIVLFAMEGSGPLAGTFISDWPGPVLENIHEYSADFTVLLVLVHIGGVLISSRLHRENLIRAMINGRKRRESTP